MLERLLSTGIALAVAIGGGAVAMEAMGLLRADPAATGQRRIDAIVAYIEAHFDPRDLPSEAEAMGISPQSGDHAKLEAKERLEVPNGDEVAVSPPPVVERHDETPVKAVSDARTVRVLIATEPSIEPEAGQKAEPEDKRPELGPELSPGLEPSPQPKLVAAAETVTAALVSGSIGGAKDCGGACNARSPARRRARRSRMSETGICPFWAGGQVDGARLGLAVTCPVALLP